MAAKQLRKGRQGVPSWEELQEQLTEDFVSAFKDEDDYVGTMAYMAANGLLPRGVDLLDERVAKIVEKCRESTSCRDRS